MNRMDFSEIMEIRASSLTPEEVKYELRLRNLEKPRPFEDETTEESEVRALSTQLQRETDENIDAARLTRECTVEERKEDIRQCAVAVPNLHKKIQRCVMNMKRVEKTYMIQLAHRTCHYSWRMDRIDLSGIGDEATASVEAIQGMLSECRSAMDTMYTIMYQSWDASQDERDNIRKGIRNETVDPSKEASFVAEDEDAERAKRAEEIERYCAMAQSVHSKIMGIQVEELVPNLQELHNWQRELTECENVFKGVTLADTIETRTQVAALKSQVFGDIAWVAYHINGLSTPPPPPLQVENEKSRIAKLERLCSQAERIQDEILDQQVNNLPQHREQLEEWRRLIKECEVGFTATPIQISDQMAIQTRVRKARYHMNAAGFVVEEKLKQAGREEPHELLSSTMENPVDIPDENPLRRPRGTQGGRAVTFASPTVEHSVQLITENGRDKPELPNPSRHNDSLLTNSSTSSVESKKWPPSRIEKSYRRSVERETPGHSDRSRRSQTPDWSNQKPMNAGQRQQYIAKTLNSRRFHGTPMGQPLQRNDIDVDEFIEQLRNCQDMSNWSDEEVLEIIPFVLSGQACSWWNNRKNEIATFEEFEEAILKRYCGESLRQRQRQSYFTAYTQKAEQNMLEYVDEALNRAQKIRPSMTEEEIIQIIVENANAESGRVLYGRSTKTVGAFYDLVQALASYDKLQTHNTVNRDTRPQKPRWERSKHRSVQATEATAEIAATETIDTEEGEGNPLSDEDLNAKIDSISGQVGEEVFMEVVNAIAYRDRNGRHESGKSKPLQGGGTSQGSVKPFKWRCSICDEPGVKMWDCPTCKDKVRALQTDIRQSKNASPGL